MNDVDVDQIRNRAVIVAITHDETRVWLLNDESQHPVCRITRVEYDHIHVRQGQAHHGHASEIGELEYFHQVAEILENVSTVILLGHGTGKANAADRFEQHVKEHHKLVAMKIAVSSNVNIPAMGDADIVSRARRDWKASVELS
jgi:stalled ribosome rescue protein Dom34